MAGVVLMGAACLYLAGSVLVGWGKDRHVSDADRAYRIPSEMPHIR
jgi:hypothetical protein